MAAINSYLGAKRGPSIMTNPHRKVNDEEIYLSNLALDDVLGAVPAAASRVQQGG